MLTYDSAADLLGVRTTDADVEALHVRVELATVAFWSAATSDVDEIAHCQSTTYRAMEAELLAAVAAWAVALDKAQPAALALYYRDVLSATGPEPVGFTFTTALEIRDGERRRP